MAKNARVDVECPCNSLSQSPDKRFVAVGGREVKIFSIEPDDEGVQVLNERQRKVKKIDEEPSRFRFIKNLNARRTSGADADKHIAWNPHLSAQEWICTASTNGKIVIWNVPKEGPKRLDNELEGHERIVNRVAWHPREPPLLLSASQDGDVKLWDVRVKKSAQFSMSDSEAVRDVGVCPSRPNLVAAAYDSGIIQFWDLSTRQRVNTINAHQGDIMSIDWHPVYSDRIASGSRDQEILVWDLTMQEKVPKHTIRTTAVIGRIQWRIGHPNQIASAAGTRDFDVHLWDVTRPYNPIETFKGHTDVVQDFLWSTSERLLTCSKDQFMMEHNVADGYFPNLHMRTAALSWNNFGSLAVANDEISRVPHTQEQGKLAPPAPGNGTVTIMVPSAEALSNEELFCHLARAYLHASPSSCAQNAKICAEAGAADLEQMWLMLDHLFSKEANQRQQQSREMPVVQKTGMLSVDIVIRSVPREPAKREVPSSQFRVAAVLELIDMLCAQGDVQSCSHIILLLRDMMGFDTALVERCFCAYVELLLRQQLFSETAELLKVSEGNTLRQLNQKSTTMSLSCGHCKKATTMVGKNCNHCNRALAKCALCQHQVEGLFVWCQGCGHGGHLNHMQEWFGENSVCPSGCLHKCTFGAEPEVS